MCYLFAVWSTRLIYQMLLLLCPDNSALTKQSLRMTVITTGRVRVTEQNPAAGTAPARCTRAA